MNNKALILQMFSRAVNVFIPFNPEKSFNSVQYISKVTQRYLLINKMFKCYINHFFYYQSKILNDFNGKNGKEKFQNDWIKLFPKLNDDEKMIMIFYVYSTRCINNNICRYILSFAEDTSNMNYKYWIIQNISKIIFLCQSGNYDLYYINRRNLITNYLELSDYKVPQKPYNNNKKVLCIVAYMLSPNTLNSSQRVVSMFASNLSVFFDEVVIVDLNCFNSGINDDSYICSYIRYDDSKKTRKKIKEKLNMEGTRVIYADGCNYRERLQNGLYTIYELNPTVIIDLSDEYSLISNYYSKDFTTYYFPLRGLSSSLFFNYFINTKWLCEEIKENIRGYTSSQIVDWTFPEFMPELVDEYSRDILGVSDDAFIIVSIGNNNIFSDNFCEIFVQMLRENENFVWLFIGNKAPTYIYKNCIDLINNNRIIDYGFEKNLYSLCKQCDVLLRYNTSGGSGATAIAAKAGLPIAMTNFRCDPMRWLGNNYSEFKDYNSLTTYIVNLYNNPQLYKQKHNQVLDLVNKAIDNKEKWTTLAEHMKVNYNEQKS